MKNKDAPDEPCEWNPKENRDAMINDEFHAFSAVSVGKFPTNWHLCEACANLPRFKKYHRRVPLKEVQP